MFKIEDFKALVSTPKKVVITAHYNPDADALGSSLALAAYLRKKGHQVSVILPSSYPGFLDWMPQPDDNLSVYSSENKLITEKSINTADLLFCLDFSTYNRLQELALVVKQCETKIFVIDHHLNPEIDADFQIWDTKASSTAELVYVFIDLMGDKSIIDLTIAERIYAGIVTDTSSFKHPTTTPRVHRIAADLMEMGLDTNRIQRLIYDNNSESRLRFLGYALKDKLKVVREYRTAYFTIDSEELEMFNNRQGDTEGFVNYALSIEGIVLAAIIIAKPDCVKMSFRSVGSFSVNEFASRHFSGGGHKNAAGGICGLTVEETEKKFLGLLPQYKETLLSIKDDQN